MRNFRLCHCIARGVVIANGTKYERGAAFGLGGPDVYSVSRTAKHILDRCPERREGLNGQTFVSRDISRLGPQIAERRIIDLAAIAEEMSPSPTPEPQPELPTSTKRRSDILEQQRVDFAALAAPFPRTPTPDFLPESPPPPTHPVLDIDASAAMGSPRPLPAERPPSASFHETLAGRSLDHQRASALAIPASPRSSTYPESLSTMPPASGLQALAIAATFARISSLPC